MDMLDVRDPDVMNTLIDQRGVESILLIEQRAEASHVMERERPAKASKVGWSRTCELGTVYPAYTHQAQPNVNFARAMPYHTQLW